ncbi:MAG: hypothetical protein SFZ23_03880 [Planctomycetota bacterium]|nr:hypothetical protein [Planctomycetota bacterium]
MGLGICVRAKLRNNKPQSAEKAIEDIVGALPDAISDPVMTECLDVVEAEDKLLVTLHPAAEMLEISAEHGFVVASTKTSTAGPGFHAAVVDVLDRLGKACSLAWMWDEEGSPDETGYALDRDYAKLQQAMASQFRAVAEAIGDHLEESDQDERTTYLNMAPLNGSMLQPVTHNQIVSPIGAHSRGWLTKAATEQGAASLAPDFYPWWTRERTPREWAKLATVLMWSELRWRPPTGEHEERLMRLALRAAEEAGPELARFGPTPGDLEEISTLLSVEEEADVPPPRDQGFGLFRGDAHYTGLGEWTFRAPASMLDEVEEDDEGNVSIVLAMPGRTLRMSGIEFESDGDKPVDRHQILQDIQAAAKGPYEQVERDDLVGMLEIAEPGEEESWHVLSASLAADSHLAFFTLAYRDATDEAWARRVIASVQPPAGPSAELDDD